ncbi:universal stress protein [Parasediminibacterium paludis]|uniref:Universal stress protein n=1 Tax=Parasediminibacterium paludis TaxID=908966 RepID=A0ABV8PXM9_9BACT
MKTILIPTDFSATSKNAALYAIGLAKQVGATKLVLYNAYEAVIPSISIDPTVPSIMPLDIETYKNISETGLKTFTAAISHACDASITIEQLCNLNTLVNGISEAVTETGADVVVMGITGGNALEESLIGSNTVDVAKAITVPMIIVPPNAVFENIEEITLAVDLKKVASTTPVEPLKKLLAILQAQFFVLHINDGEDDADKDTQMTMLNEVLKDYNPQYFFVNNISFIDGINDFVDSKNVDLLVTIPKKHGWFEMLFKRSHTKLLAFHSHVPLMVVHD